MFTIKHYNKDTGYDAYEAESYTLRHYSDVSHLDGFMHDEVVAKFTLTIKPEQHVFIENSAGKTIDSVKIAALSLDEEPEVAVINHK